MYPLINCLYWQHSGQQGNASLNVASMLKRKLIVWRPRIVLQSQRSTKATVKVSTQHFLSPRESETFRGLLRTYSYRFIPSTYSIGSRCKNLPFAGS